MLITRAHKTEIAPTVRQRKVLELHGHVARKLYNWALLLWRQEYLAGRKPDAFKIHKSIVARRRLLRGSLPDTCFFPTTVSIMGRNRPSFKGRPRTRFIRWCACMLGEDGKRRHLAVSESAVVGRQAVSKQDHHRLCPKYKDRHGCDDSDFDGIIRAC